MEGLAEGLAEGLVEGIAEGLSKGTRRGTGSRDWPRDLGNGAHLDGMIDRIFAERHRGPFGLHDRSGFGGTPTGPFGGHDPSHGGGEVPVERFADIHLVLCTLGPHLHLGICTWMADIHLEDTHL